MFMMMRIRHVCHLRNFDDGLKVNYGGEGLVAGNFMLVFLQARHMHRNHAYAMLDAVKHTF